MRGGLLGRLLKAQRAAVAPTIGISLFALIGVGGIAFDYARLAAMDTELQNAADQAALAAASQLDGTSTAITRATNAAQNLIQNKTLFANETGSNRNITVPTLTFYSAYNDTTDTGTVTTTPASANFVQVTVGARKAFYALTPVVAAFNSGDIAAMATAGLGSAVCNVPPLMVCPPDEDFPSTDDIGIGLKLQPGPQSGAWAPGDYGYLDFGNGASGLKTDLGSNGVVPDCDDVSDGITTEPGNKASVTKALNTRFDLHPNGQNLDCVTSTGDYCPSENTRKDLVRKEEVEIKQKTTDPIPNRPACGDTSATVSDFELSTSAHGFTRDTCHIDGTCSSNYGDGDWDIDTYFAANHPTLSSSVVGGSTRYNVYQWELTNPTAYLPTQLVSPASTVPADSTKIQGANTTYTFVNYCAYPQPVDPTDAVEATTTQKDRRILTIAAVDCSGLSGKKEVPVRRWIDVFLVEPSLDRSSPYSTGKEQIYVEVIGPAKKPDGSNAFQYYSRKRPYLLK